jgi:cation diffusion facilitator family transporter
MESGRVRQAHNAARKWKRNGEAMTAHSSHEGHEHHHGGEHDSHDSHDASDAHGSHGAHGHTHGSVDPSISSNERGLWAVKWGFVGLFLTASLQLVVVFLSHSVALLADTIHNFGDAGTAIPLGIAFLFARRAATPRFTYGFGRVEDLAGLAVVLTIFASAGVAFYQAINRLIHPHTVSHIGAIIGASIIGFLGNELVAVFRIRVGKEIGSAALIADGYHARTDGWTSLAVLAGALGVYFGYPKADPIIGLLITVAILGIVWQSVKLVFARMLDGVEPGVLDEVRHSAGHVPGVDGVSDVRARWIGHTLRAEVSITVDPHLTVQEGHDLAKRVEHEMGDDLKFLSGVTIHIDPAGEAGEQCHRAEPHDGATASRIKTPHNP